MKWYSADMHLHSVLSPCGDLEMSPSNILSMEEKHSMDIISLTDHNSSENCIAMKMLTPETMTFIPGMEVSTGEDIHLLVYFESLTDALAFQDTVFDHLKEMDNIPSKYGDQVVVDCEENIVRMERRLLISSISMTLEEVIAEAREKDALIVLSHVDAEHYSAVSQLGFIPKDLDIDGVEISSSKGEEVALASGYPVITNSDSHYLDQIGKKYTDYYINEPSLSELKLALRKEDGRDFKRRFQ